MAAFELAAGRLALTAAWRPARPPPQAGMAATLPGMPPPRRRTPARPPDPMLDLDNPDPAKRSAAGRAIREQTKMSLKERARVAASAQPPEMKAAAGKAAAAKLHSLGGLVGRIEARAWRDDVDDAQRAQAAKELRAIARRLERGERPE